MERPAAAAPAGTAPAPEFGLASSRISQLSKALLSPHERFYASSLSRGCRRHGQQRGPARAAGSAGKNEHPVAVLLGRTMLPGRDP